MAFSCTLDSCLPTSSGFEMEKQEPSPADSNPATNVPDRFKDRRRVVKVAWEKLVRWSRSWRFRNKNHDVLERINKVVVLGGGSFGTAMAAHVASWTPDLEVHMLLRDPLICQSINDHNCNCKYFPKHKLPKNVVATTDAKTALLGADYCLHAVAVQFRSLFLENFAESHITELRIRAQHTKDDVSDYSGGFEKSLPTICCIVRTVFCPGIDE